MILHPGKAACSSLFVSAVRKGWPDLKHPNCVLRYSLMALIGDVSSPVTPIRPAGPSPSGVVMVDLGATVM